MLSTGGNRNTKSLPTATETATIQASQVAPTVFETTRRRKIGGFFFLDFMVSRKLSSVPSLLASTPTALKTVSSGSWRAGKSSSARGYGYRWQKERAEYLRLRPFCVMCLRDLGIDAEQPIEAIVLECAEKGSDTPLASVVDHSDPHRGNERVFWDKSRWQGLCATHHSGEKQRSERGRGGVKVSYTLIS